MKKRIYSILIALASLVTAFAHEEILPDIPHDSVTVAFHQSFVTKLDSAAIYTASNDYQKAVRMYVASFEDLKQFNEHRREHAAVYLAELYETEQKEQRILFLDELLPLKEKQNFLLVILCFVFVGLLIAVFIFLKYHLSNILQKAEEIENEARLIELGKEERLLENRLQTMEVEKYQKELLAESLLINHKNKVLEDLRLFLIQTPRLSNYKPELESILGAAPAPSRETPFQVGVDNIHPAFYTHLQQQANNKLTPLDIEYCRLIFLKMSPKEMADILQVDPATIRMGKYRLKRKLGLGKEDDLTGFIEEVGKKKL